MTFSGLTTYNAWYRYVDSSNGAVGRDDFKKEFGLSVRCLKD